MRQNLAGVDRVWFHKVMFTRFPVWYADSGHIGAVT